MSERMWNKGDILPLLVGMQTCTATLEISMVVWLYLRKLRINLPQDPQKPLLGIYPKDVQSYYKDICSTMFLVSNPIVRTLKQPRFPSTEEWIKKM